MTCEVVVANRLGIALAADSAVTFTDGSADRETYASGANKIFQLTAEQPVAVMVYNNADLDRIPWEVILKTYRRELGTRSFATLEEYGRDLIDFINDRAPDLLPADVRKVGTRSAAIAGVLRSFSDLLRARPLLADSNADPVDLRQAWDESATEMDAALATESVNDALAAQDLPVVEGTIAAELSKELGEFLSGNHPHLAPIVDTHRLVNLGLRYLFCRPDRVMATRHSGIVVAGFGASDYMPGYWHQHVFSFVGSRVYWKPQKGDAVNYTDKGYLIEPFARKSMVETFTQGASPEVWKAVRDAFEEHSTAVVKKAATAAGVSIDDAMIETAVAGELADFTQQWAFSVLRAHLAPLRAVIAGLNVGELAELAETLVMLESLKEKVTSRTQGVGGPVDLAVITKGEGLVWIKRKHYFNPDLNQRYLLRLQRGG